MPVGLVMTSPTIQTSEPLWSPSPPAFHLSQHQGLSNESVLLMRWPKCWSFSFSISPSNDYSGLISFRIDWFALLAVQVSVNHLQALLSKSLIQFFADGWGCVPSLSFGLRPNYGRGNGHPLQKNLGYHAVAPRTIVVSAPDPAAGDC